MRKIYCLLNNKDLVKEIYTNSEYAKEICDQCDLGYYVEEWEEVEPDRFIAKYLIYQKEE